MNSMEEKGSLKALKILAKKTVYNSSDKSNGTKSDEFGMIENKKKSISSVEQCEGQGFRQILPYT